MRNALSRTPIRLSAVALVLFSGAALFVGCSTSPPPADQTHNTSANDARTDHTRVIRYGRYTLVELVPNPAQQDLMQQVIDVTVPSTVHSTVGDALHHVLLRSGYQLCDDSEVAAAFDALPLPSAHTHLGPLILRDALLVLVGPAWQLEVDEATRHVCFSPRGEITPDLSFLRAPNIDADVLNEMPAPLIFEAPVAEPQPKVVPAETSPVEPPFTPLGIELRDGEYVLSLLPSDARSPADVRILRPGDSEADWQLETLEAHVAYFRIAGRTLRITLP